MKDNVVLEDHVVNILELQTTDVDLRLLHHVCLRIHPLMILIGHEKLVLQTLGELGPQQRPREDITYSQRPVTFTSQTP